MSAGSGPLDAPRAALNAASCRANERVDLKNRNGFSTCQINSAAWTVPAAKVMKIATSQRLVDRAFRRMIPLRHPHREATIQNWSGKTAGKFIHPSQNRGPP